MGTTSRDASCHCSAYFGAMSIQAYHSRAWEDIPTETKTIAVLNFRPLLFQRLDIHGDRGSVARSALTCLDDAVGESGFVFGAPEIGVAVR